jgi:Dna[CI] antecedent, DciA
MAGRDRRADPCKVADLVGGFVQRLAPVHARCDSVGAALEGLLPPNMRDHCRFEGVSSGNVKIVVDGASYMYELQLCKSDLVMELQRLCPSARVSRIQVVMTGQRR